MFARTEIAFVRTRIFFIKYFNYFFHPRRWKSWARLHKQKMRSCGRQYFYLFIFPSFPSMQMPKRFFIFFVHTRGHGILFYFFVQPRGQKSRLCGRGGIHTNKICIYADVEEFIYLFIFCIRTNKNCVGADAEKRR
jgi:hypothetical protein